MATRRRRVKPRVKAKPKAAPKAAPPPPAAPPGDAIGDEVRRQYGYLSGFFDHAEVGPLLRQAAAERWDAAKMQGALSKLPWWQKTAEAARSWAELQGRDPAEARRKVTSTALTVRLMGVKMGVALDPGRVESIATDALRMGWSEAELNQAVAAELRYVPGQAKGDLGTTTRAIRGKMRDYEVGVGDATIGEWALAIMNGTMADEDVDTALDTLARGKYPSLAGIFDKGIKPRQFLDSYRSEIANTMEVSAELIDFGHPDWSGVLSVPDKDGPRVMSISEATRYARSKPGFRTTRQANERSASVGESLLKTLGAIA